MMKHIRKSMPLLPISIVMQLTELTARQIRNYEDHELITPARTTGNKRMFSLNDVDTLLEIKDLLEQGINLAGVKKIMLLQEQATQIIQPTQMTDAELRKLLRLEMQQAGRFNRVSLRQGDLNRYFH